MKKWLIGQLLIVFSVMIFGQICKANFTDHGLYRMKTFEDGYSLECGVEYILNKKDLDSFVNYQSGYIESVEEYPIVVIGKPTGNIEQALRSFGQEVIVEKVIKGSGIEEKNRYYIYNSYGFKVMSGNRLVYYDTTNVMNPDSYYLIFMKASELNPLTSIDSYSTYNYFPYFNISRDRSFPIEGDLNSLKYTDLKESEFFASSQEIIDQIHKIKHKIIEKYKDELGDYLGIDLERPG